MELLYLYVFDYRGLQNEEFVFSDEYKFNFDEKNNKLTITEYNRRIKDFFGDHIINVSFLVGENGVGKSTILKSIYNFVGGNIHFRGMYLVKNENGEIIFFRPHGKKILIDGIKVEERPFGEGQNVVWFNNLNKIILHNDRSESMFWSKESNISLSVSKDQRFIEQELQFLNDYGDHPHFGEMQYSVDVWLDLFNQENTSDSNYKKIANSLWIKSLLNRITNSKNESSNDRFNIEDTTILAEVLLVVIVCNGKIDNENAHEIILNSIKSADTVKNFLDSIEEEVSFDFVKHFRTLYDFLNSEKFSVRMLSTNASIGTSLYDVIILMQWQMEPYECLQFVRNLTPFSNMKYDTFIKFRNRLSTGQQQYLNIYSSLYSKKWNFRNADKIWVMIDEIDIYLHPIWQIGLFNEILKAFNQIFPTTKIQLFIATHSPLQLSDIPNKNVIFMKRGNKSDVAIRQQRTFAENIGTLYEDAFFIEGAFIGDFAKSKIKNCIKFIKDGTCDDPSINSKTISQIIALIGEPLIRNKLNEMLAKKNDKNR
ncbi:MAG: ATP-binding protein [Cytophagaceae bacterium]|jgi:ABC-type polar amino acid transport system ATPase subunit|nr:ATP-binding protein [Cytophagaceae bacterium]